MAWPAGYRHAIWSLVFCACAGLAMRAQDGASPAYRQKVRTFHTAEEFARVTAGKVTIDRRVDPAQEAALHKANVQLPNHGRHRHQGRAPASAIWIGTRDGRHPSERRLSQP